jgi:hypothetical protein
LAAEAIGTKPRKNDARDGPSSAEEAPSFVSALDLLDRADVLVQGGSRRYVFSVTAESKDAILRGIASGDLLGRFAVTWRKSMGETGRDASPHVYCPPVPPAALDPLSTNRNFVVHRSGLSVDVAAAAAVAQSRTNLASVAGDATDLSRRLAVTVEPIDPPKLMHLQVPRPVQLLVVNHSTQPMTLQVRFDLSKMSGIVVCGTSFQTLDNVPPNGGSTVVTVTLMALSTGLLTAGGCCVADLVSGREIHQPPLFHVLVGGSNSMP